MVPTIRRSILFSQRTDRVFFTVGRALCGNGVLSS
jgi:hypothetical protein